MAFGRKRVEFDQRAPLLEADDIQVTIGKERILESASLTLQRGELLAVVGPNGAGKST
ncbi:MAG: ATP-binding cassette domain-containing protein, partial [Solirubrobacterales bacterium]|nr:ATP-binding cassette domain-containing protein [Solirubrobacterales bacterium]